MDIEELRKAMSEVIVGYGSQPESAHGYLDDLLIEYINDEVVTRMWKQQERWYS